MLHAVVVLSCVYGGIALWSGVMVLIAKGAKN